MKKHENCSFFVSTSHLLTIILPYINEKLNEGKNVKIISQKDLSDDVRKYLKNVKEFNNENIKKIYWKNKKDYKNLNENTVLFIIGEKEFVENEEIDKNVYEIVRCYDLESVDDIKKVAEKYEYHLRTDGRIKLTKNSQKEQNSNTIKSQL